MSERDTSEYWERQARIMEDVAMLLRRVAKTCRDTAESLRRREAA